MGRPDAHPSVVADRRADGRDARRHRLREPVRHAGLVGGHEFQVCPAAHGLPGAGVHERARPDLVDAVLLLEVAAGCVDDGAPHRGSPVVLLDRLHLPVVRRARHVQPAEEHPPEGVQRPEQEARHDVGAERLLELDGPELDGQRVPGVELRVQLVDEVTLILDEERHRHAVGDLAAEDGCEALARIHRARPPRARRCMTSQARRPVSAASRRTASTCPAP